MQLSGICLKANRGAIFPNSSNFRRAPRFDIVHRMRHLVDSGMYNRPAWLTAVENAPPPELHNMRIQAVRFRNPYPKLVAYILKRYPDLRFQDLYVEGNDWTVGNDTYRDDHPVMQFAARQLRLMNEGYSQRDAFDEVSAWFENRRRELELKQKLDMAATVSLRHGLEGNLGYAGEVRPIFPTGQGYLLQQVADRQARVLQDLDRHIRAKTIRAQQGGANAPSMTEMPADWEPLGLTIDRAGNISVPDFAPEDHARAQRMPSHAQRRQRRVERASHALRLAMEVAHLREQANVGAAAGRLSQADLEELQRGRTVEDLVGDRGWAHASMQAEDVNRAAAEAAQQAEAAPVRRRRTDPSAPSAPAASPAAATPKAAAALKRVAEIERELEALMADLGDVEDSAAQKTPSGPRRQPVRRGAAQEDELRMQEAGPAQVSHPLHHWSATPMDEWTQPSTAPPSSLSDKRVLGPKSALRRGSSEARPSSSFATASRDSLEFKDLDDLQNVLARKQQQGGAREGKKGAADEEQKPSGGRPRRR